MPMQALGAWLQAILPIGVPHLLTAIRAEMFPIADNCVADYGCLPYRSLNASEACDREEDG